MSPSDESATRTFVSKSRGFLVSQEGARDPMVVMDDLPVDLSDVAPVHQPRLTARPSALPDSVASVETIFAHAALAVPTVVPARRPPDYRFVAIQSWEGTVQSVHDNEFTAFVRDRPSSGAINDEAVTLPIDEVPEEDRELLVSGAVFYWSIGYEMNTRGQKKRVSTIRFRRLPRWTRAERAIIEREAEDLHRFLNELESL